MTSKAERIIAGLGGADNIIEIEPCITRLRTEVADGTMVDEVALKAADWSNFATLILAPGIPLTHPAPHWSVARAKAASVEVIGDIELFFRERARHAIELTMDAARAGPAPRRRA